MNCVNDSYLKTSRLNRIKNIKYSCSITKTEGNNEFSICLLGSGNPTNDLHNDSDNVHAWSIELDPSQYECTPRMPLVPREGWFLNTCNIHIPTEVSGLLQLGEGFCCPPDNKTELLTAYIKHIESNFLKCKKQQACITSMRIQFFNFLKSLNKLEHHRSDMDERILDAVHVTKKFVKDNPDILFTRADKGNTVVALDRSDYIKKMEAYLSDTDTYTELRHNPVRKLLNDLKALLKRWTNHKYVSSQSYSCLNSSNAILPRAYGLPKIHKTGGYPLRIIISSTGSPLHNLALYLHKVLINSLPPASSHIKNSTQLVKNLSNLHIPDDYSLASFDVVSLFTNVPIDLVLQIIKDKWSLIEGHTSLPQDEFVGSIEFVLKSTFFVFNNKFYKQTFGTPMGSPLSPIVADLVLQRLELSVLNSLSFRVGFFYRYVDDIALSVPLSELYGLLGKFNSFHPRLRFTIETSVGGDRLNFLDLSIIKKDNGFVFDWFRKPTFSGRFLNFHSHHPFIHKRGTVYSLIDRVVRLSHPQFHKNNFDLVIKVLLDNGYPLELIFSSIRRRLNTISHSISKRSNINVTEKEKTSSQPYFVIPYVSHISERFIQYFKNISFSTLAFSCVNKLKKFIRVHKDTLPIFSRSSVVYKIDCMDCDASYVGQTKRTLNTRVSEHRNHIRRNSTQNSVITDHRLDSKHDFKWNDIKILDEERNYNRRLISEMIFIKKQKNGLNAQLDTALLDPIYNELF